MILIATILSPLIFTQFHSGISFKETGPIGDTIGGLTAPCLNFLSVILLYLTLREQINYNKKQDLSEAKNKDYNIVSELVSQIKHDFEHLFLRISKDGLEHRGPSALFEVSKIATSTNDLTSFIDPFQLRAFSLSLGFLVHSIQHFLVKNYNSVIDVEEKEIFYSMVQKLQTPIGMTVDALHTYAHRKGIPNLTEEEKTFCMMNQMKILLGQEFTKYKPTNKQQPETQPECK